MNKIVCLFLLIVFCWGCSSNSATEKHQGKRDNVINVRDRIKEIVIEDILVNSYSWPIVIDNYMLITDYKTANEFVHIFDKNDFKYITSIAPRGQGPGEIARIGSIEEDKMNRKFYVSDFGKYKIFSYDLDSAIADPAYLPIEKMTMNEQLVIEKYTYINDTLSIGVIIQRLGNGNFNPIVAKFNMATGKITRSAATCGNNDILKLGHLVQHTPFQFTKRGLSPLCEQFTNRFVKTFFYVPVQIDKRYIQFAGKSLSQSSFTGSHVASQKDTYHNCLPFAGKDKQTESRIK